MERNRKRPKMRIVILIYSGQFRCAQISSHYLQEHKPVSRRFQFLAHLSCGTCERVLTLLPIIH